MAQITKLLLGLSFAAFVSAASIIEPCRPACPSPEAVFPHHLSPSVSAASIIEPCRPACPSPEAVFPHPQDCTKFFHCAFNIPFEKSCPHGLYFSPHLLRCDVPSIVNCLADPSYPCVTPTTEATQPPSTDGGHGPNASSTTASPHHTSSFVSAVTGPTSSETPEDCRPACPTPEALLAHPRDCRKYYNCSFSVAYEKVCLTGLVFSVNIARCDYQELLDQCTATEDAPCDAVITVVPTEQPRNPTGASQTGVKRDISVNVTLATISSANGTMVSTVEPNVTLSSSIAPNVSLTPTLAPNGTAPPSLGLNGTVLSTAAPASPTSQVAVCHPTCGPPWIFPHPWYCNKFFLCSNFVAIEMTCPEGLFYAKARYRCDYPYMSECVASPDHPCL